jgi:hypothetical protein
MAEQIIQCTQACTITVQHQLSIPLLDIDAAGGGAIAMAIALCWAAGFAIRQIIRLLRVDEIPNPEKD